MSQWGMDYLSERPRIIIMQATVKTLKGVNLMLS